MGNRSSGHAIHTGRLHTDADQCTLMPGLSAACLLNLAMLMHMAWSAQLHVTEQRGTGLLPSAPQQNKLAHALADQPLCGQGTQPSQASADEPASCLYRCRPRAAGADLDDNFTYVLRSCQLPQCSRRLRQRECDLRYGLDSSCSIQQACLMRGIRGGDGCGNVANH